MAARLQQDGLAARQQLVHQRVNVLLQQRLATGDFDKRAVISFHLSQDVVEVALPALVECTACRTTSIANHKRSAA